MSEPSGYLLHGTAFSSKEAAFEILVHNHEQELRFNKLWDEDAQPYYFENKPQLTIPESVAEELDNVPFHNPIAQLSLEGGALSDFNDIIKSYAWQSKENGYICVAYLAGKALGVDLVKVVEG